MSITENRHSAGVRDYRRDTLEKIAEDLDANQMSRRKGTWENLRLAAIRQELRNRREERGENKLK